MLRNHRGCSLVHLQASDLGGDWSAEQKQWQKAPRASRQPHIQAPVNYIPSPVPAPPTSDPGSASSPLRSPDRSKPAPPPSPPLLVKTVQNQHAVPSHMPSTQIQPQQLYENEEFPPELWQQRLDLQRIKEEDLHKQLMRQQQLLSEQQVCLLVRANMCLSFMRARLRLLTSDSGCLRGSMKLLVLADRKMHTRTRCVRGDMP